MGEEPPYLTYHKAIVINVVGYCQKSNTDQRNKIKNPGKGLYKHGQVTFDESVKTSGWRKEGNFNEWSNQILIGQKRIKPHIFYKKNNLWKLKT
jgi:hypothetical protein